MSVKSTKRLTRSEAEELMVELRAKSLHRMFKAEAVLLSNRQLEDTLERLNDELHDGEGFENYLVE
jgi:hypothetical protein